MLFDLDSVSLFVENEPKLLDEDTAKMLFREVLKQLKSILPERTKLAVTGGAVRDVLVGRAFKDIDVAVILPEGVEVMQAVDHAQVMLTAQNCGFDTNYGGLDGTVEDSSDFQLRLYGVLKATVCDRDVDLLFQKDNDFEEIVKGYDHVANMVYFEDEEFKVAVSSDIAKYLLDNHSGFNYTRGIRDCRVEKMSIFMESYEHAVCKYLGVK